MYQRRPPFEEIKSYKEFSQYYWYRAELTAICRKLHLDTTGVKLDLIHEIESYYRNGKRVIPNKASCKKKKDRKIAVEEITLNTSLLKCNFSFNNKFRLILAELANTKTFKFTADMAATWREVKKTKDESFTFQDLLNIAHKNIQYTKYNNTMCQWNQFLKDFHADKPISSKYKKSLQAAATLWNIVKNNKGDKVYTHKLAIEHQEELKVYL